MAVHSNEEEDLLTTQNADEYIQNLQKALAAPAHTANTLPGPSDLPFHRSVDPKFAKQLDRSAAKTLDLINSLLEVSADVVPSSSSARPVLYGVDDVVIEYPAVTEIVDGLLEVSDKYASGKGKGKEKEKDDSAKASKTPDGPESTAKSSTPSKQTSSSYFSLPRHIRSPHIATKPQTLFLTKFDNTRGAMWKPSLQQKHNAIVPLDLEPAETLDFDTNEIIYTIANPYRHEISTFLDNGLPSIYQRNHSTVNVAPPSFEETPFELVDTLEKFKAMFAVLKNTHDGEIAIDLEHHSVHSYMGFTCLIQISTRKQDWILDVLNPQVRANVTALNELFTDPNIVKIFHGAASDVLWLQQDFSVYIVNLFDTAEASRVLENPKNSLSALLELYCNYTADKRYQMADWRLRPLPLEMLEYARSDTHFLHYIYDHMKEDLWKKSLESEDACNEDDLLLQVVKLGSTICLSTFKAEDYNFISGKGPKGWRGMIAKWLKKSKPKKDLKAMIKVAETSDGKVDGNEKKQGSEIIPNEFNVDLSIGASSSGEGYLFEVMRALHEWRDQIARIEDESIHSVLPDHQLITIAQDFQQIEKDGYQRILKRNRALSNPVYKRIRDLIPHVSKVLEHSNNAQKQGALLASAGGKLTEITKKHEPLATESSEGSLSLSSPSTGVLSRNNHGLNEPELIPSQGATEMEKDDSRAEGKETEVREGKDNSVKVVEKTNLPDKSSLWDNQPEQPTNNLLSQTSKLFGGNTPSTKGEIPVARTSALFGNIINNNRNNEEFLKSAATLVLQRVKSSLASYDTEPLNPISVNATAAAGSGVMDVDRDESVDERPVENHIVDHDTNFVDIGEADAKFPERQEKQQQENYIHEKAETPKNSSVDVATDIVDVRGNKKRKRRQSKGKQKQSTEGNIEHNDDDEKSSKRGKKKGKKNDPMIVESFDYSSATKLLDEQGDDGNAEDLRKATKLSRKQKKEERKKLQNAGGNNTTNNTRKSSSSIISKPGAGRPGNKSAFFHS